MGYQLYVLISGTRALEAYLRQKNIDPYVFMGEFLFSTSAGGRWRRHGGQPDFSPAIKMIFLAYLRSDYQGSELEGFVNEIEVSVEYFDRFWEYREHHGGDDSIDGLFSVVSSKGNVGLLDKCRDHPLVTRLLLNEDNNRAND